MPWLTGVLQLEQRCCRRAARRSGPLSGCCCLGDKVSPVLSPSMVQFQVVGSLLCQYFHFFAFLIFLCTKINLTKSIWKLLVGVWMKFLHKKNTPLADNTSNKYFAVHCFCFLHCVCGPNAAVFLKTLSSMFASFHKHWNICRELKSSTYRAFFDCRRSRLNCLCPVQECLPPVLCFSLCSACLVPMQTHLYKTRRSDTKDASSPVPRSAQPFHSSTPSQTWWVSFTGEC